ncbi:MAG TPA: glucokinase [Sphingomonas sp.]|jgi:glucokinase
MIDVLDAGPATLLGLAVDLSTGGMAKVAPIRSDGSFEPGDVQIFPDSSVSTLTGVLTEVERRIGRSLRNCDVALAIPGVPGRAVIPVLRSRWTLSREGLDQFFGKPVTIVNDGAALAWAAVSEPDAGLPIGDTPPTRGLGDLGRRALIQFEAGLGAAVVDSDARGGVRVFETEMGHVGFTPDDELDDSIVRELRAARHPSSWERVLRVGRGIQPSAVFQSLPAIEQRELFIRWSADFVGTVVLGSCAWDGVYLSGSGWGVLKEAPFGRLFMTRLRRSRAFPRQFEGLPCWHVAQKDAVLRGCAQLLLRSGGMGR